MATETSEVHRVTEALVVAATSEAHRVTEVQVETTLEVHRVMEVQVETTLEGLVATETSEALVETTLEAQTVTVARREDLREPLQTADAETGPTTKAVPTIV